MPEGMSGRQVTDEQHVAVLGLEGLWRVLPREKSRSGVMLALLGKAGTGRELGGLRIERTDIKGIIPRRKHVSRGRLPQNVLSE